MTEREGGLSSVTKWVLLNRIIAVSCGGHHLGLSPRGPGLGTAWVHGIETWYAYLGREGGSKYSF